MTSKENLALGAVNSAARTGCVVGFTSHPRRGQLPLPGGNRRRWPSHRLRRARYERSTTARLRQPLPRIRPQLAELFHSRLPVFVKNGKTYPIASLDRSVYLEHFNHVHAAVNKGTSKETHGQEAEKRLAEVFQVDGRKISASTQIREQVPDAEQERSATQREMLRVLEHADLEAEMHRAPPPAYDIGR